MGRRRKEPLIGVLIRLPWWMGVLGAVVILTLRAVWLQSIDDSNALAGAVRQLDPVFYLMAALFALGALGSFVRQWRSSRKLDLHAGTNSLADLSWREFESVIQEAFRRQGYLSVETPAGPDGGYDIGLRKDGKLYLVQCKHWKARTVGVATVRELFGVVTAHGAENGFLVTSGYFTDDAKEFAAQMKLELVDGPKLWKMIAQVARAEPATDVQPDRIDPVVSLAPDCPKCGAEMVKRVAKKGANAGKEFWGCSEYPRCWGVVG